MTFLELALAWKRSWRWRQRWRKCGSELAKVQVAVSLQNCDVPLVSSSVYTEAFSALRYDSVWFFTSLFWFKNIPMTSVMSNKFLRGHRSEKKLLLVDSLSLENVIFLKLVTLAYSSVKFLNCVLINVRIRELILFVSVWNSEK